LRKQLIQLITGSWARKVSFIGKEGFNETRNLLFGAIERGYLVEVNDPDLCFTEFWRVVCDVGAENDFDVPCVASINCATLLDNSRVLRYDETQRRKIN